MNKIKQLKLSKSIASLMDEQQPYSTSTLFWYLLRLFIILCGFFLINRGVIFITKLPTESYSESILAFSFLKHVVASKKLLVFLIVLPFFIFYRKRLLAKWGDFDRGKSLRTLFLLIGGILTWMFSLYEYNFFYDQSHLWDRLLLIVCLILIYIRPVFILPFLIVLLIIIQQFKNLVGYSWAVPSLPIGILLLFFVFYLLYLVSERFIFRDFIFLLICFFASHYWLPGSGKVNLFWITENRLSYLISSTYTNGWLAFLSLDQIDSFIRIIDKLNTPLKVLTILFEFGSMFIFINKKVTRLFFAGWIFMHIGIFLTSGICFWVWSLIELIFLISFTKKDNLLKGIRFTKLDLVLGGIIIICGSYWSSAVKLFWFDSPLIYVYRYEAEMEDGKVIELPHTFFTPYDYQFTINSLSYLSEWPLLEAEQDPKIIKEILKTNTHDEIFDLEQERGNLQYDEEKAKKMDIFIRQYIKNWNKKTSKEDWWSKLQAPRLLWTFPRKSYPENIGRIRSLKIKQITSLYLNHYEEIREKEVLMLKISDEKKN